MKTLRSNDRADRSLDDVARFVDGVRATYLTAADPKLEATLMGLMRIVNLEKGDPAVRPASEVNGPDRQVSGLPIRRSRFMFETLLGTLAAKIAAGGLAIAMASTGAVAATGNLPDRMQTGLSEAASNVGIDIPLGETAALEQAASEDAEGDSSENAGFGQDVAEDAQDGGVDGQEISDKAREMADERKAAGQEHRPEGVSGGSETADEHKPEVSGGSETADQYKPEGVPGGRP